jgi:hypothetical protein
LHPHAQRLRHHHSLPQTYLTPEQEDHQRSGTHKAQTANLDHTQNHKLTKAAPLCPGIKHHKSYDTGGRGCGKQCRTESAGNTAARGHRKGQKPCTQQDDAGKGNGNDFHGT